MNMTLHTHTPTLVVTEPRGLIVRSIAFYRREQNQPADERVNRQTHDAAGRLISQRDPRLAQPNLRTTYSLSSQPLLTDSVDAGWRLALLGEAEQIVAEWDGRGSQRQIEYDALLRPLSITEQGRVSERFTYGGPDAFEHNQCNQLIRHDDTAGSLHWSDYGVPGSALNEVRRFLQTVETPDWPLPEAERDALLEAIPLETRWAFNAVGDLLLHTDAMGHTQHFSQTVAGQLKTVQLTLAGATQAQTLVSDVLYNAFDQVEQETAGNGIVSRSLYNPQDGRLMERSAEPLQHLIYSYDPVGNIQQIEDRAQPVRFFANQQVEPISHYRYDTLYQLIEAMGREVNTGTSHGPALPDLQPLPPDPNQVSNYTQTYDYDSAGNLLQMRNVGAQAFTRTMRVTPDSNRSLPAGEVDTDFNEAFDANGNLLQLIRGQTLEWDVRNQLQQITTVTRATEASDHERYIYDGQGQRCRKISSVQTSSRTLSNEVRYLPGLEIRTTADGEILHVVTAHNVRVLHWQTGQPSGIENDQIRYNLNDHLGSSTLELDHQGGLISQESYYPFGGTSWWAARNAVDAKYKTIRYSGKERDASGLYYYGLRYYAPWLQRWINPDPAGDVDGLNLFRFSRNAPTSWVDPSGSTPFNFADVIDELGNSGDPVQAIGIEAIARKNPRLGGSLLIALSSSKKGITFAQQVINQSMPHFASPADRKKLLTQFRTSPEAHSQTDTQILRMLSQSMRALSAFLQTWDSTRIVAMNENESSRQVAWQYTDDPEHHLFMRAGPINEQAHMASWNIIHEASHIALSTNDFWYINTPEATPAGASGADSYSERIETLTQLQRLQRHYKNILWSGPDAVPLDSKTFNEDPLQRTRIILKNADSISLAVSYINEKFNGPMARLSVHHPSSIPALDLATPIPKRTQHRRLSL
ncbi:RHS repeat domain-containing protein [Pseudomonas capsici]|uniref:RHS repeat protein n=1 Tax=Pseudomonas capsici TaxID=2810614 RepID=A0ABT3BTH7_9PSED|nr:RHS repeat-associated core domain-containing protein [Pseudomonas capsici]MCV4266769.1 RHS repeat protein [Pseudomonas capsici]MCV4277640.1 RHS repeat protein [Pseudomonas capsici]MCV4331191.1 RHS repeat protein [Pseudomonas capsici]MCV4376111.1 RHS repeat protein [Pseudomonas capsici]